MGWWSTGHGHDIIGDDVADALTERLRFLEDMTDQKPSFQELLDRTADLVITDGDAFLSDAASVAGRPIEAVFEPPAPTLVSRQEPPVDDLMFGLVGVFVKVAELYEATEHARKPRLSEVLSALTFVLSVRPEELLRDAKGLSLVAIRAAEKK
jgi:hypothetical protein